MAPHNCTLVKQCHSAFTTKYNTHNFHGTLPHTTNIQSEAVSFALESPSNHSFLCTCECSKEADLSAPFLLSFHLRRSPQQPSNTDTRKGTKGILTSLSADRPEQSGTPKTHQNSHNCDVGCLLTTASQCIRVIWRARQSRRPRWTI